MPPSAVDLAVMGVGAGVFLVCLAFAAKIVSDIRLRSRVTFGRPESPTQDRGVLDKRLQDFQTARFGRPMVPNRAPRAIPTWPVISESSDPRRVQKPKPPKPGTEK